MNNHIQINVGSYFRDIEILSIADYKIRMRAEVCFSRDSRVSDSEWEPFPWVCFLSEEAYGGNNISMADASVLVALFHLLCL